MHAAFGDWLEASEKVTDEHASLLAYHFSEAALPQDADLVWADAPAELDRLRATAVRWLQRAAELARHRYELEEAVELFRRAVEISVDEHQRARLWGEIGRTQALRYDAEAMRTALDRSLAGPLDDAERADTYAFLALQASIRSAMWSIRLNRDLIEEWVEQALQLAEDGSDAQARALTLPKTGMAVAIDIGVADNIHPKNKQEVADIEIMLGAYKNISLSDDIGQLGYNLMKSYAKSHGLETPDALIAATAIHEGLKLSTTNRKHFDVIGGLEIEVPEY
jgi:predicted nucleic acid-binding protein